MYSNTRSTLSIYIYTTLVLIYLIKSNHFVIIYVSFINSMQVWVTTAKHYAIRVILPNTKYPILCIKSIVIVAFYNIEIKLY